MSYTPSSDKHSSNEDDEVTETQLKDYRIEEDVLGSASLSIDLDAELKKISLQKKKLEIEKVSFDLERERSSTEIALRREKLDLELKEKNLQMQLDYLSRRQEVELQEQFESSKYYRQLCRAQSRFKMVVSIVLIITGIW